MLDIGRICLKNAGREAGRYCVIINNIDDNFVMITGPKQLTKVKRRRCNILHLEPLEEKIKIKSDAIDAEILKEYAKANLFSKLKLEKPVPVKKAEKPEKPEVEKKPEAKGIRARLKLRGKAKAEPKAKIKEPAKPKPKVKSKTKRAAKKTAKKAGKKRK